MVVREAPASILHGFVKKIHDSIIEPLKKNQVKLSWQREIRESKRFQEAETKIDEYLKEWDRFKDNFNYPDKVLEVIHKIHSTRMTQFLEKGNLMSPEESEELQAALAPYNALLQPMADIKRMQVAMMNQGKMKKMTLPYDEVTATLNEVSALVAQMPQTLMNGVSDLANVLEQQVA